MLQHVHAGEQQVEVLGDDVLEWDEARVAHREEAVQRGRHFDPGEQLGARLRVAHDHGEVQRQPRDVGERMGRVDGQGGEHRVDLVPEQRREFGAVLVVEFGPANQCDALGGQSWADLVAPALGLPAHEVMGVHQHRVVDLAWEQTAGRSHSDSCGDAALEACHPHHEELVEVGGEDRQELGAFQQRQVLVLGKLQHPLVEREPTQFTIDEPVFWQFGWVSHPVRCLGGGGAHVPQRARNPMGVPNRACRILRIAVRAHKPKPCVKPHG